MTRVSHEFDVLLFDLGGVLIDFRGFEALNRVFENRYDASQIRSRWLACTAVTDFECGRIAPAVFAERFVAQWELDWSPAHFLETFASWVTPLTDEATALLAGVRGDFHLACLSNCNEVHWAEIGASRGHFDSAFLSFEMGVAKPDSRIFEQAVAALGVPPDRIRFFDDTEENLHAARALGIRGELVRGLDDLATRLSRASQPPGSSAKPAR